MKLRSIDYLPAFMLKNFFYDALLKVMEDEFVDSDVALQNVKNEMDPGKATLTLSDWENLLGISVNNDKPAEYRRSVIVSRLRSSGTLTNDRFKEIALSFENGDVEIDKDYANYKMTVRFVSEKGVPPNFDDFKEAVRIVNPSHVEIVYEFSYNTRGYFEQFNRGDLENFTKGDLRTSNITEVLATL